MSDQVLKLEDVSVAFGGLMAVDAVSFQVAAGEIVGLIGPNGAGKTTLFNAVSGYYKPTRGRITFLGHDVTGHVPYELAAKGIGIDEVTDVVQRWNVNMPTGELYGPNQAYTIQAKGQLYDAAAYKPLIVAYRNGSPVKLTDVATVIDDAEDVRLAAWTFGLPVNDPNFTTMNQDRAIGKMEFHMPSAFLADRGVVKVTGEDARSFLDRYASHVGDQSPDFLNSSCADQRQRDGSCGRARARPGRLLQTNEGACQIGFKGRFPLGRQARECLSPSLEG